MKDETQLAQSQAVILATSDELAKNLPHLYINTYYQVIAKGLAIWPN
jgi:hypothetical protein